MGIFDGFSQGIMPFARNNSDTLVQTGLGLLSGRTAPQQAAMAAQGFSGARKRNKTVEALRQIDPQMAELFSVGDMDPNDALKMIAQNRLQAQRPKTLDFQTLPDGTYGTFDPSAGTFNPLGSAPKIDASRDELGLNLVWGKDAQGRTVAYQPSKSGGLVPVDVSEGVQLSDPYVRAFDSSSGKAAGEVQGGASANLGGAKANVDRVGLMIKDLKDDPNLGSVLGWFDSRTPNLSAGSNRVQSKINQLGGTAFLEARQMLKGGGAITDFESQRAEHALVRLNQAQDENDFKAALDDFNKAVVAGYQKLEAQAAMPNNRGPRPSGMTPADAGANPYKNRYGLE